MNPELRQGIDRLRVIGRQLADISRAVGRGHPIGTNDQDCRKLADEWDHWSGIVYKITKNKPRETT
jgi:hypothetical protein